MHRERSYERVYGKTFPKGEAKEKKLMAERVVEVIKEHPVTFNDAICVLEMAEELLKESRLC